MDEKENTFSTRTSNRETGIELLRILCMLMIVAHHCIVHGGAINMENCQNKVVAILLFPGGKIGFTCFLAISTWFLVDMEFKTIRLFRIWGEVFFYSIVFAIITFIVTDSLTVKNIFSALLPVAGNSHGFASAYIMLYLLLPFLRRLTDNISKFQARCFLALLFYAQIGCWIIGYINNYYQLFNSELLLFVFFYVLSLNLKRWPVRFFQDRVVCLLTFASVWLLISEIIYLQNMGMSREILDFIAAITQNESSILYILAGYSLFFLFLGCPIKHNKVINMIAATTFGVLLIHDHNYFRTIVWDSIVKCTQWYYSPYFVFYVALSVLIIFVVCGLIDFLRKKFIEEPLFRRKELYSFGQKLDEKLNERGLQ